MKILLIGYGKMGQIIEKLAVEKGHEIIARYNSTTPFNHDTVLPADVAIEFSSPHLAVSHLLTCIDHGIPVVTGTTGWYQDYEMVKSNCLEKNGTLFTATNFSLGVNLFFEMSRKLTRMMNHQPYQLGIEEIHHTEKKDAPSGTAITLAETILEESNALNRWVLTEDKNVSLETDKQALPIVAKRLPGVPGTHILTFESEVDIIKFEHEAKSRLGFASGAVLAAEWVCGKSGVFGMRDLLNFEG
ncbi:MAG: 4-hydroxy-tetrahydrodipicolinate reductase [Sphingomonadales bacterium]|nr:4-hydroxy-tetrahydrodipicolinate reductase [Sphingomonadales bacterium]